MTFEVSTFIRKLLASLYQCGVSDIPFSGASFTAGIEAVQASLQKMIPEETYDRISDVFIKTPVQEEYNQLQDMIMELNGDMIGFSSVKNPYWKLLSINMTPYYAKRILDEPSSLQITNNQYLEIANQFCNAAGVGIWARF